MIHNDDYIIELFSRTINASGLEATITPFVEFTLIIGIPGLIIYILATSIHKTDPAFNGAPLFTTLSTPIQIAVVVLGISIPVIILYGFLSCYSPYGDTTGHKFFAMPKDSSDNPNDQTLTTALHDDIVKEIDKRQEGFDKFGLSERCEFLNDLTDNHPESVLCGGTQLKEVETDNAVFTPYIEADAFASDPHSVNVTVNVRIDVK